MKPLRKNTTHLTIHHVGDSAADNGPYTVVRVTTTYELVAGPFARCKAAKKWMDDNNERANNGGA